MLGSPGSGVGSRIREHAVARDRGFHEDPLDDAGIASRETPTGTRHR
jgi:hypothetical protein